MVKFFKREFNNLTKTHLKALFKALYAYVDVFTNLEDIETPEEREQPKFSDTDNSKTPNPSDLAVFIRTKEKSFFYIYFANGDFDEVEIK